MKILTFCNKVFFQRILPILSAGTLLFGCSTLTSSSYLYTEKTYGINKKENSIGLMIYFYGSNKKNKTISATAYYDKNSYHYLLTIPLAKYQETFLEFYKKQNNGNLTKILPIVVGTAIIIGTGIAIFSSDDSSSSSSSPSSTSSNNNTSSSPQQTI